MGMGVSKEQVTAAEALVLQTSRLTWQLQAEVRARCLAAPPPLVLLAVCLAWAWASSGKVPTARDRHWELAMEAMARPRVVPR